MFILKIEFYEIFYWTLKHIFPSSKLIRICIGISLLKCYDRLLLENKIKILSKKKKQFNTKKLYVKYWIQFEALVGVWIE